MTEAAIAKATGLDRPQVTASLAVARSETATRAADEYGIDLLQAAIIAEFDGDDDAVGELLADGRAQPRPARLHRRAATADRQRAPRADRLRRRP